jgi:hypothetical protein
VRAVGSVHITTKNFYMAHTYHQIYLQIVFAVDDYFIFLKKFKSNTMSNIFLKSWYKYIYRAYGTY